MTVFVFLEMFCISVLNMTLNCTLLLDMARMSIPPSHIFNPSASAIGKSINQLLFILHDGSK